MFTNYTFSNSNFFIIFFLNRKIMFETIKKKYVCLIIYLYIYYNTKFHISKNLPYPSTLNSKLRLVNPNGISIFYPSLQVMVKMVSINMKSGIMNVVFVKKILISQYNC